MNNQFTVKITKVPGGAKLCISDGDNTIEELFEAAFDGESIAKYQIQVNGENKSKDYTPAEGEVITVAKQVKGNL